MNKQLTLLAAALCLTGASQAATYTFSGQIDAGPLVGASFSGSYDLNLASLTNVGFESLLLDSFSMAFNGGNYSLTPGATADYQDGVFLGLSYESGGAGFALTMTSGSIDVSDAFLHYQPTGGAESSGGYTVQLATAVPEPATWALSLAGVLAVGSLARRRSPAQ